VAASPTREARASGVGWAEPTPLALASRVGLVAICRRQRIQGSLAPYNDVMKTTLKQPTSSRPQPFACRLRHKVVVGKRGPIPNMGELDLENQSSAPLEIAYTLTPFQFLELVVTGPSGVVVSEGHVSDRYSPSLEPLTLRLLPGEKFSTEVPLFATVPQGKRLPGVYQVQAVYDYDGYRAVSDPVMIKLEQGA